MSLNCAERLDPVGVLSGFAASDETSIVLLGQDEANPPTPLLPSHTTKEARIKAFKDLHNKAAKAQGIVVAGAGHAGVEVAGELKAALPNVEVTLVGRVLARSSTEFQRRVKFAKYLS